MRLATAATVLSLLSAGCSDQSPDQSEFFELQAPESIAEATALVEFVQSPFYEKDRTIEAHTTKRLTPEICEAISQVDGVVASHCVIQYTATIVIADLFDWLDVVADIEPLLQEFHQKTWAY